MSHKAGFVNIIGSPNVGKSTLLNALVGERLAVVTAKAQTTRRRMFGMVNTEDFQVVFSDTPGILQPGYALQQAMMNELTTALEDADIFLLMTEPGESFRHTKVLETIATSGIDTIVLINKIDLSDQPTVLAQISHWQQLLPAALVMPVSALHGFNLDQVMDTIVARLPEHPPFFDKDDLTDKTERFIVAEIIRGCILVQYRKEVPYSVEVVVESFRQEEGLLRIQAVIYLARESQKPILLGEGGKAIKRLGTASRKAMETFLGQHVFLELLVKVSKDWRDDPLKLKKFGYQA